MDVTVAEQDKLKRKLTVEVPLSEVEAVYQEIYGRLRANIRVAGFRPGRYPRHLAEKRFKEAMAGEAMQTLVPRYFERALGELEMRPATEPRFDNLDIDKNRPFRFDVEFELVPTFELLPPSSFRLDPETPQVAENDVDERIEELRNSRAAYEDKGREPAARGDVVTFDFRGTLDGQPFQGGSGENQRIELGSTQYLPGFDDRFEGITAGETRSFPLAFPDDYPEASLAGREAEFEVTAHRVEKKVPPPLDENFFAQFGTHETEQEFREAIRGQLLAEQERDIQARYASALTGQIGERYDFEVPETLVDQGLHEFEHQLSHDNPGALDDENERERLKAAEREKIVTNLRIAYVVDALAREKEVTADEEQVRQRFFMQAYMMRQNPAELVETPHGRRMLMQIEQGIVTDTTLRLLADEVLQTGKGAPGKKPAAAKSGQSAAAAPKAGKKSPAAKSGGEKSGAAKSGGRSARGTGGAAKAGKSKAEPAGS